MQNMVDDVSIYSYNMVECFVPVTVEKLGIKISSCKLNDMMEEKNAGVWICEMIYDHAPDEIKEGKIDIYVNICMYCVSG